MWMRLMLAFLVICEASGALHGAGSRASKSANVAYFPPYDGWRTHTFIMIAVAEVIGIYCVYRLWRKETSKSVFVKIVSSVVLLVPIAGPVFYYFVTMNPAPHYRQR